VVQKTCTKLKKAPLMLNNTSKFWRDICCHSFSRKACFNRMIPNRILHISKQLTKLTCRQYISVTQFQSLEQGPQTPDLNQVCWSRETSKTCRTVVLEGPEIPDLEHYNRKTNMNKVASNCWAAKILPKNNFSSEFQIEEKVMKSKHVPASTIRHAAGIKFKISMYLRNK